MSDAAGSDSDPRSEGASSTVRPSSRPPPDDSSKNEHALPDGLSVPPPRGWRETVGEACGLALAACLLGSIPAAMRVARAGGSILGGLFAAAAIVLPPVALAMSLSRAAGRGFRMVTGLRAGRSTVAVIALWIGLMSPVLLLLGAVLKDKTNHRGLGGTTFGVLALIVAVGAAAVAYRLVRTARSLVDRGVRPRMVATSLAVLAIAPLLVVSYPLLRGHDDSPNASAVAAALIDGVIFTIAGAVAVTYDVGDRVRATARRFGIGAAAVVVSIGLFWLSLSPRLAVALRAGGGLAATLVGGLERWTDRDGDGFGAHFGGRDCDEGDPRRHPGAFDPPGDGIDQDCDGVDGTAGTARPAAEPADTPPTITKDEPAAVVPVVFSGKPSIILVTLDTVRADHTSAYGYEKKTTPRLEALAAKGALFKHAYAPASDSQRAMMPLFSAVSYRDTPRGSKEWPRLKDEANTLAERLHAGGYHTVGVSSFQWLSNEQGFHQGFDSFVETFKDEHPERGVTGPLAVKAARAAIENCKTDTKPLFLWVHLFDAHEQYRRHDGFTFGKGDEGAYDSEVGFVDKQLGDLVDAVEASHLKGRVVWIVHGSQGEGFDEHGASGHGRDLWDEMVRVPLVVALPNESAAKVIDGRAVSTVDIVPTILEIAGLPTESFGTSLLAASASGKIDRGPVLLRTSKRASVIDWPYKLIVVEREKKDRVLLFDLSKDPKEQHDMSADAGEQIARLRALIEPDGGREKRN